MHENANFTKNSNIEVLFSDFFLRFAVKAIKCKTSEHAQDTEPLASDERVSKQQHGAENGEELAGCGDYGARQGTKVCHGHEDEILQ